MLRRIHTKSNSVKNLLPTLSFNSKISGPIQKEIDLVLENPPQIPSVINGRKNNSDESDPNHWSKGGLSL